MGATSLRPLGAGFLVAIATSGGLVGERLSEGDLRVAVVMNALITSVSVFALFLTARWDGARPGQFFFRQALGALLGIGLVHLVLRGSLLGAPWLSERPAQLVNDLVAVFGALVLVWAASRRVDARVLLVGVGLVSAYRASASHWHLDQAPHGFVLTIQQLVVMQLFGVALAMIVFRAVSRLWLLR